MIRRFDDCELDERRAELRRGGRPVEIQPKPLALLVYLVTHRDRMVTKGELMEALWPGVAVSESSLTKAVSVARAAIGDRARRRIRSFSRRGYRFAGEVVELPEAGSLAARGAPEEAVGGVAAADAPDAFVGRAAPLELLRAAWRSAADGAGRLVIVSGEAGIGKSRLARVFADELREQGAHVLCARADDNEGAPAFWIWVQVLRELAAATDLRAHAEGLGAGAGELGHLVPELRPAGGTPREPAGSPEQSRFLLFDALARLLAACARERPLALVLEDVHWAARPSLLLLEHVAEEIAREGVLVVATARDEPRERGLPWSRTFAVLARLEHVAPLALDGFSDAEVASLLERRIGRPPPTGLVTALLERTEGNPLFLCEAVRVLSEAGQLAHPELVGDWPLDRLPERVRGVVRRRLDTLSAETLALLDAAAVVGRAFHLPLLARAAGCARERALDALDEAVTAGVVELSDRPGVLRFAHPLYQEVTYEALPPGRRARLHWQVGEALERAHGAHPEAVLSELAHHFHRGIGVGDPERAYAWALAAANEASRTLAYEQAAAHFEQAVDALEHCEDVDPERRVKTLLRLGEALRFAGDRGRRREVFGRAAELARRIDRPREFVLAAIGFCDLREWSPRDEEARVVLAEALQCLDDGPSVGRARLTARLGYLLRRDRDQAEKLVREAADTARELGDPDARQEALYALHLIIGGPDGFDERIRLVEEMAEVAPHSSYDDLAFIGLIDLACDHLSQGRRAEAQRARDAAVRLAGDTPHRALVWHRDVFDAGVALLEGRFEAAEAAIRETAVLGRALDHPYAGLVFAGQTLCLLRDRGRLGALPDLLAQPGVGGDRVQLGPYPQALTASLFAEEGRRDEARVAFDRLADEDLARLPRQLDWLGAMAELARTAHLLEDADSARILIELIEPVAYLHAVIPVPVCYAGPLSRPLGLLWLTLGELAAAERALEDALARAGDVGARPMEARIRADLARVLLRRGRVRPARSLLREALDAAETLGMHGVAAEARQVLEPTGSD